LKQVIEDERTSPRLRALLQEVPRVKAYGEERGLKPTSNYAEYVRLDRPAAVWVVSACRPLKFESKEWSFPIAGRFPYLGWFDRADAEEYADELRSEGWDVDVRGASAYSTLGWFRDAILSSMIPEGEGALGALVNVVLHESVHATWYLDGQAYYNESLASFVADRLTPEYLKLTRGQKAIELDSYLDAEKSYEQRTRELHAGFLELEKLYSSTTLTDEQKLEQKGKVLRGLEKKLGFKREINNATLVQFKTYNTGFGEFEQIFATCGKDWSRFWKKMREVTSGHFPRAQSQDLVPILRKLLEAGCA
jgi:predicted aminopeptidase